MLYSILMPKRKGINKKKVKKSTICGIACNGGVFYCKN